MRKIQLLLILFFPAIWMSAQTYPVNNGGFEEWSLDMIYENPITWMNSNAEMPILESVMKSDDAFEGNFSLFLESVYYEQDEEDRFGWVMLGDPSDDFTGIPYNTPVDSLVAHVKYDVQQGDSALILVVQFINGEEVFNIHYLDGTAENWTRVAMPLFLPAQDSILVAFASGNGLEEFTIAGSTLMVDDVKLISNSTTAPALPNAGFEDWTPVNYEYAEDWTSFNFELVIAGFPENVTKSLNSYSGTYSAYLETVEIWGDIIPGVLTNGEITDDGVVNGTEFFDQPETFEGYYQYFPSGNDQAEFHILFSKDGNVIGHDSFLVENTVTTFTKFTIDLNLTIQPDEVIYYFSAGHNDGSALYIDDIAFAGGIVGTTDLALGKTFTVAPNPTHDILNIRPEIRSSVPIMVSLLNVDGKLVFQNKYNSVDQNITLHLHDLPSGVYWLRWESEKGVSMEKIVKH